MTEILKILEKIAEERSITEEEKKSLVGFCEEKGWFNKGTFLTEKEKYNFIVSPMNFKSDYQNNFLAPDLLYKTLNSKKALDFFTKNLEIKEEFNPLSITYVFSALPEEHRDIYNNLSQSQKEIFTGYLSASCNHYYPAGAELNRARQPKKLLTFLNTLKDYQAPENSTKEELITFGKESYVFENFVSKKLQDSKKFFNFSPTELDNLFKTKIFTKEATEINIDYENLKKITYIFNEREFASFDFDFKMNLVENVTENTRVVISATYCPPEIIEKQKQAIISTYNEVMNYGVNKLSNEENVLFSAKKVIVDEKVNILKEMRKYATTYNDSEINLMMNLLLKTYKEKSEIDNSFKDENGNDYFDITMSQNDGLLEEGDSGHYTAAYVEEKKFYNATLQYVSFNKLLEVENNKISISKDNLYPSGLTIEDKIFFQLNDVVMHEMHHAYQDYLINKYILNTPNIPDYKNTPEYKYALLCKYSNEENLKYFDKPNEITAFSLMSFTDNILGNFIFPDAQTSNNEYTNYQNMIGLNYNSADTVKKKLDFYKNNPQAIKSTTEGYNTLGGVSLVDLTNLGKMIAPIEGTSYYLNAKTNQIEIKQK